jgi:myo-inositol-1(or 4)-monophosphatase
MDTSAQNESRELRKVAEDAALAVDAALRSAFRSEMTVAFKRDEHDVVTEHDRASEAAIRAVISERVPDSTIIGEEAGVEGDGRVRWYVDPIDGTSNFARGIAYWCVSIAAEVDGAIVAGVVFDPMAQNMFAADLFGATLNGRPIRATANPAQNRATIVTSYPAASDISRFGSSALDLQTQFVQEFQYARSLGSGALNLAHVAAGWADATMGFDTNSWDIAAGAFILEQAGGMLHGFTNGKTFVPGHLCDDYYAVGHGVDYPTLAENIPQFSSVRGTTS